MIIPHRIQKGETIGVFTASDPINPQVNQWIQAGIKRLESMGFRVIVGETLTKQDYYAAGTSKERWEDFRNLLVNTEVKMIMTAMGGHPAHQILPFVDFELVKKNPKIIMGYSDPTVLLNPITEKSGLVTFYGFHAASFDPNWEWFGEYDLRSFERILMDGRAPIQIEPASPRETYRGGIAEGTFVGGCLGDLVKLLGTSYEPTWDNRILILEHVRRTPQELNVDLTHLKQAGVFAKLSGLLLGKFYECMDKENESWNKPLKQLFLDELGEFDFPILKTEDFGHFSHMAPIPIGGNGRIDADAKTVEILERCTQ